MLFVSMTILGGAMRPGYSHVADTVSELFSPGSPNKALLDPLHTIFTLLLVLFGVGLLQFVRESEQPRRIGMVGATLFIAMGLASVTTATVFPQDAWGSPPTLPGEMHKIMSGVVALLTLLSMALLGIWFKRTKISPDFGIYSFITVGANILGAGFFAANWGSPIMGLAERVAILLGFQWTFTLALWLLSKQGAAL
ncbi:MAG: DUF998 domain-containing protein [Chloroflexi bacterium]|nr:DUF998 domain-containing protein [Chloroflexota bacterium]